MKAAVLSAQSSCWFVSGSAGSRSWAWWKAELRVSPSLSVQTQGLRSHKAAAFCGTSQIPLLTLPTTHTL